MREHEEVYKRIGRDDYVIKTIVQPSGLMADIFWYVRNRRYPGITEYTIKHQSPVENVALMKDKFKPQDLWALARQKVAGRIDEYIANVASKTDEELANVASKDEIKAKFMSDEHIQKAQNKQ